MLISGNVSNSKYSGRPFFAKRMSPTACAQRRKIRRPLWKESLRNYCKLAKFLPNISETGTTRVCRMFMPLTKQTFVKCNESEVCFPATLLSNWSDIKNGKKSLKNQVIARQALVDWGKKTQVLSTKGDSVTKFSAVQSLELPTFTNL